MKVKTPEFEVKWWTSVRPPAVKGSDLQKALKGAEKALAAEEKKGDAGAIASCIKAVKAIPPAAKKAIRECDAKQHKEVISALKEYDGMVKAELKRLDAAMKQAEQGEDEDDEGKLFEKDHLYKMIKLIKSANKQLNFGFGLNTSTPDASDLLLHRKKNPEMLFKALKKTKKYNNRVLTYGIAKADPSDAQTLIFQLERGAGEPPRIVKLGREFLRSDKTLKFKKLKVVLPGGRTLDDSGADDESA